MVHAPRAEHADAPCRGSRMQHAGQRVMNYDESDDGRRAAGNRQGRRARQARQAAPAAAAAPDHRRLLAKGQVLARVLALSCWLGSAVPTAAIPTAPLSSLGIKGAEADDGALQQPGFHIQSVGACGDTAGSCLTMTPVDRNPKGSFLSVIPCDTIDGLQQWTFDPIGGHICSANVTNFCIHLTDTPIFNTRSWTLRVDDKMAPAAWSYNPSTSALCSQDGAVDYIMDNGGAQGDSTFGNNGGSCDSPNGCGQWKFIKIIRRVEQN
jgi:hypothetical protein